MRDIRNDLRERLASVSARYADEMVRYDEQVQALHFEHKKTISELDRERTVLQQALDMEDARSSTGRDAVAYRPGPLAPLVDFLITKVHTHGPLGKDELRAEVNAAGYFAEGSGRTFHTTLMNITKNGRLKRLPDGRYAFGSKPSDTLFGMVEPEEATMRTVM